MTTSFDKSKYIRNTPFDRRVYFRNSFKYVETLRPSTYYQDIAKVLKNTTTANSFTFFNDFKNSFKPDLPNSIKIKQYFMGPSDNINPNTAYKSPLLGVEGFLYINKENFNDPKYINAIYLDRDIIFEAVKSHETALLYIPEYLYDYDYAIKLLSLHNGIVYIFLPDILRKDPRILTWISRKHPELIYYVDTSVPDYEMYVCYILKNNGMYLRLLPLELQTNEKFIAIAVNSNGNVLEHVSTESKKIKTLVLCAVKNKGMSLKFADPEFQADYEVVSNAVQQDGNALEYASPELKESISIVIMAMLNTQDALQYVSSEMKSHSEIIALGKVISNKRKRET